MVHNFRVKTNGERDCGLATGQGITAHSLMNSFGKYLSGPLLSSWKGSGHVRRKEYDDVMVPSQGPLGRAVVGKVVT